jgi:DNA-binding NtrC family response regulator
LAVIKVNVRLICATNRDLEARVEAGQFRADLFYRINVFPVRIPALNERPDDVRGLIDFFTRRHAMGDAPEFSEHDLNTLTHYAWPGNIRELRNLVERACVIYAGEAVDLPTLHPSIYRRSTDSELPAEAPVEADRFAAGPKQKGAQGEAGRVLHRLVDVGGEVAPDPSLQRVHPLQRDGAVRPHAPGQHVDKVAGAFNWILAHAPRCI